jgi:hypothetical protein
MGGLISWLPSDPRIRHAALVSPQYAKRGCYLDDNSPVHILEYGLPAIALTAAPAPTTAPAAAKSTAARARLLGTRFIHG